MSHLQAKHAKERAGNEADKRVTKCVRHPGVGHCSYPKKKRGGGQEREHIDGRNPTARRAPRDSEPESNDEKERRRRDKQHHQNQHSENRNERHIAILHFPAEYAIVDCWQCWTLTAG